jgi:hypothetical protein
VSIHPVEAGRQSLPREVAEFLVDFQSAQQRFQIYPDGHSMLEPAVKGLVRRLEVLFFERAVFSIGVTPTALLVAGMPTDPNNTLLRDFAARLHRANIGGVKFLRGVTPSEVASLLGVLRDESQTQTIQGSAHDEPLLQWPHIRLFALTYDYLQLLDDDEQSIDLEYKLGSGWAARLWVSLVKAGLGDDLSDDAAAEVSPETVAAALNLPAPNPKRDERIIRALLDFAEAARGRGRAESLAMQQYLGKFIGNLSRDALQRLLHMDGDVERRRKFLLDAGAALFAGTVLELVEVAAAMSDRSISPTLLQMLAKLGKHADEGIGASRMRADVAVRQRITTLLESWARRETTAAVPDEYRQALTLLPFSSAPSFEPVLVYGPEPQRLLLMSFELGVMEAGTRRSVDQLVEQRQTGLLLDLLERTPPEDPVGTEIRTRVYSRHTVARVLREEPVDLATLERLVARVGRDALEPMLDTLTTSKERKVRAKLIELIAALGSDIGHELVKRMGGAPWFLQRNLLRILAVLPELPQGFTLDSYVQHVDPRVRHEAIKLLLRDPVRRIAALRRALSENDPATVRLAVMATLDHCPAETLPLLINRLRENQFEPALRPLALRAIASVNDPRALEMLLGTVRAPALFGVFKRIQAKSPELLEALSGLAIHWPGHKEAAALLAVARRSKDPEVRRAAAPRGLPAAPAELPQLPRIIV